MCRIFRFINIFTKGKFEWKWQKSEPDTQCACEKPKKFLARKKEFLHKDGLPVKWNFDYCKECKMWRRPRNHFIAFEEFRRAELFFFKMTQRKYFFEDLKVLKKPGKTFEDLPQNSTIKTLSPFIDASADIIRMTSRIRLNSLICASVDRVILPKDSEVMRKWVKFIHVTHNHTQTENPDLQVSFFLLDYPITEDNQTGDFIDGVHLSKNYARAPAQLAHLSSAQRTPRCRVHAMAIHIL